MIKSPDKGCTVQLFCGWAFNDTSGKVSSKQEALVYSPTRTPSHLENDVVVYDFEDYPFTTLASQLRFNGSGKAIKLRYESLPGKDFVLEGYSIEGITKREPEADK